MRRVNRPLWLLLMGSLVVALAGVAAAWRQRGAPPQAMAGVLRRPTLISEGEAQRRFTRDHPGEQPVNWAMGAAAVRFRKARPMGAFVLGLGEPGNDCSDFVACCIDEGLGVGARFKRGSDQHLLGERAELFDFTWWRPGQPIQPGDVLSVRHSPWYPPNDASCWHCGIVGSDRYVYDFSKLKQWREPRYGRHELDEFVRYSLGERQIVLQRLGYLYRYRQRALPGVSSGPGRGAAGRPPGPARPSRGQGPEG